MITDTDGAQTTTGTISFSVAYNVTMSFSKSSMTFNYGGGSSVNTIYFSGYGYQNVLILLETAVL